MLTHRPEQTKSRAPRKMSAIHARLILPIQNSATVTAIDKLRAKAELSGLDFERALLDAIKTALAELEPAHNYLFCDVNGHPNPVDSRIQLELAGVKVFDLAEASEHFGWSQATLEVIWQLRFENDTPGLRIAL